ncbi:YqjF family protein [Sphingobacterium faecium]|uniref:YqjF family protein n=1 Tax=Sphingobacterium faecium TaxID=34087 RepID=UPI0032094077
MIKIKDILSDTTHRPFELPEGQWEYYQEWNNTLFLHWVIPYEILQKCVPRNLNLDTFDGLCYVSLVAFTMENIRPKYLPSISFISNFDEINLRTYIENDNKKGVYFLNIEAGKLLSAFIAKSLSGLPYEKSNMKRSENRYTSRNVKKDFYLDAEYKIRDNLQFKSELDKWLTERYCLYLESNHKFYRYDIHHKEWELKHVELKQLRLSYKICDFDLIERSPNLVHYSQGVKVLAWKRQII